MKTKTKRNYYLEICGSIFTLVGQFRQEVEQGGVDESFSVELEQAFVQLDQLGFEKQLVHENVQHVKYALAAFVDEILLHQAWSGRNDWMSQPLQLKLFGEHLAGEGFFKRLDSLRQRGAEMVDILEVYYVCLQLGFEGIYRMSGLEKLMGLQVDLRSQIDLARGGIEPRLAPEVVPQQGFITHVSREVPFWVVASVTLGLLLLVYTVFSLVIDHQANKQVMVLQEQIKLLVPEDGTDTKQAGQLS